MVAAGDARRRLDRGPPRELRRLSRALRFRRQVAARVARHRAPRCAPPAFRWSSRCTTFATRIIQTRDLHDAQLGVLARVRGGGDHADARGGRDDRCALGPGGRGPAASARRRLGHDVAAATGARRLCRRTARQEPSGEHGRGGGGSGARGDGGRAAGRAAADRHPSRGVRSRRARVRPGRRSTPCARSRRPTITSSSSSTTTSAMTELWEYLNAIDVSVLPYRFGTHSGWLEACFDLGTAVVAPSCGFYAEQRPCVIYRHDETGLDAASLAGAVRSAYAQAPGTARDSEPAPRGTPSAGRRPSRRSTRGCCDEGSVGSSRPLASRSSNRSPAGWRPTSGVWPTGCARVGTK